MTMKKAIRLAGMTVSLVALHVYGADPAAPDSGKKELPGPRGQWVDISAPAIEKIQKEGGTAPKGGTAGVAVDRVNGHVYMVLNDAGLLKSADCGQTFERTSDGKVTGHCETGFALDLDPEGNRLAFFMVYGNSAITLDGGKTWKPIKGHVDWGLVNWADPEAKTMITHSHGAGRAVLTTDGGKTWSDFEDNFSGFGLFDDGSIVGALIDAIFRSEKGGVKSDDYRKTAKFAPSGISMRVFKNVGYWTSRKGLLVSKDKGKTWSVPGSPVDCKWGPFFGKDETQIVVVGEKGVMKTTDSGQTWQVAAPVPEGFKNDPGFNTYGWDPINDIFYASSLNKPTYRYQAAKP